LATNAAILTGSGHVLLLGHGRIWMLPFVFRTESLPARLQYDCWRDWKQPLLDVTTDNEIARGFGATLSAWKIGDGLFLTEIETPASTLVRSPRLLRRTPDDHWVISHLLRGSIVVNSPKGTVAVSEGQSYVWSLGQPSTTSRSHLRRLDLYLSRDCFLDVAPLLDTVTGLALDGPLERSLGKFLVTAKDRLAQIPTQNVSYLVDVMHKLIASTLAPTARQHRQSEGPRGPSTFGRLEQVRQAVRTSLQSPHLDAQMLCRSVGASRSNLYRMLEGMGGVSSFIQRHRLLEAHHRLSDIKNVQPIEAVAHDLCFTDTSSFSRAFRAAFGISPSEVRSGIVGPAFREGPQAVHLEQSVTNLVMLLRS